MVLRPRWLLLLALLITLLLQGGVAQDDGDDTEGEDSSAGDEEEDEVDEEDPEDVVSTTKAPHRVYAINPPKCAELITTLMNDATQISIRIIAETRLCAEMPMFTGSDGLPPWEQPQLCAESIIKQFQFWAKMFADGFAMMFNCLNENQGCAQSVAGTIAFLMDAINTLIQATRNCNPPLDGSAFPTKDRPDKGLRCWRSVWHIIAALMKAAKGIDVALASCPQSQLTGGPKKAAVAPPPAPVEASTGVSGNDTNATNATEELLGASAWAAVNEQPMPWTMRSMQAQEGRDPEVALVERRLSAAFML